MANLTHLWKVGDAVRCRMDGVLHKGAIKEVYADHVIVDIPEISDHVWFEEGLNMGDLYPEYNFNADGDHIWSDAALKKAGVIEEDDEPKICGIMYDHGDGKYSLCEGYVFAEEEETIIRNILAKYDTDGCSVYGTKKQIAEEMLELEGHASEKAPLKTVRLRDCVEIFDEPAFVLLKVKENKEMDMIMTGLFEGNETMFRITKGKNHTCTTWYKNGNSWSWEYGIGGHTLVADSVRAKWNAIKSLIAEEKITLE